MSDALFDHGAMLAPANSVNPPVYAALDPSPGASSTATAQVNSTSWTNPVGGLFSDPANWSNGVPLAGSAVSIDLAGSYTVTLDEDISLASLTLGSTSGTQSLNVNNHSLSLTGDSTIASNGVLNLSGTSVATGTNLTIQGVFNWSSGALGSGGSTTIADGGALNIATSADHDMNGHTLTNNGTVNWTGGRIRTGSGGNIVNGGIWNDQCDGEINHDFGFGPSSFTNSGTYRRRVATGTKAFTSVVFNSAGIVDVQSGTLDINAGGSAGGTFTAAATATVDFNSSYAFADGVSFSGPGAINLAAGTSTFSGTLTTQNLTLNGATIAGDHTIVGTLNWIGGTFNSSGTTTIDASGTLLIAGSADHDLNGRNIVNNGLVNWTGGRIRTGSGGNIVNNGLWNDQAGSIVNHDYGFAPSSFINNATYNRLGDATTTSFQIPFVNNSTVNVLAGSLNMQAPSSTAAASVVNVSDAASLNIASDLSIADQVHLTGAGTKNIESGTTTIAGTLTATQFFLAGGNLAGDFTFVGDFTWIGGAMNSAGTMTIDAKSTLNLPSAIDHDLNGRTLVNNGVVNWKAGRIRTGSGGNIVNNGNWNDQGSGSINHDYGFSASSFVNAGTYTKSGAAGQTLFDSVSLINNATFDIQTGTVLTSAGGSMGGKALFDVSAGASINFVDFTFADGAMLTGDGDKILAGGTLTLNGSISATHLVLAGGTLAGTDSIIGDLTWTGGTMNSEGITTIPIGSLLNITTSADHDLNTHTLENFGTVSWAGGRIRTGSGGNIVNSGTWIDQASGAINHDYGFAPSSFVNAGLYDKTSAGSTTFLIPLDNIGTIKVEAGTLSVNSGGSNNGTGIIAVSDNAVTSFNSGYSFADHSTLTGPGIKQITSSAALNGTITATALQLTGGTVSGDFTLAGDLTWNGGDLNSSGTATIAAGSTLNISTNTDHDLNGRTIVNNGIVNWLAGRIRTGSAGNIVNNSTWNDASSGQINHDYGFGPSTFINLGTYTKTASSSSIAIPFNNTGTLDAKAGSLQMTDGVTQFSSGILGAGTWTIENLATVGLGANITTNVANVVLTGAGAAWPSLTTLTSNQGQLRIESGATLSTNGALTNSGSIALGTSAAMSIAGAFTQTATGSLAVTFGGAGEQPPISVAGAAALDGTLTVSLSNGVTAHAGDLFPVITFASHSIDFPSTPAIQLAGGLVLLPQFTAGTMNLLAAQGGQDVGTSIQQALNSLFAQLPNWAGPFNLDSFDFAKLNLPTIQLPVLSNSLADLFNLKAALGTIAAPSFSPAITLSDLVAHLEAAGVVVDAVEGGLGTIPDTPNGEIIVAHLSQTLSNLLPVNTNASNANTNGILKDLASTLALNAQLDVQASVNLSLAFGVDADGFFISATSPISVHVSGSGTVSGSGNVAGVPDSGISGNASADLAVALQPQSSQKLRISDLASGPSALFVPTASGSASMSLNTSLKTTALAWSGSWTVSAAADRRVSVTSGPMGLSATFGIPGFTQTINGVTSPALVHLAGTYAAPTWTLASSVDPNAAFQLSQFAVDGIQVNITIGSGAFQGTFGGTLHVLAGDSANAMSIGINLAVTPSSLQGNGQLILPSISIGTSPVLVMLTTPAIDFNFAADLNANTSSAGIAINAAEASVLPAATNNNGSVAATGISGSLDSRGNLVLTSNHLSLSIGDALSATASSLALNLAPDRGPTDTVATISGATVALTSFPDLPPASIANMTIAANGSLKIGTFTIGDASHVSTLGNNPRIATLTGLIATFTDLQLQFDSNAGQFSFNHTVSMSAVDAALFPDQTATTSLTGLAGSIDVATGSITLSVQQLTTSIQGVLDVMGQNLTFNFDPAGPSDGVLLSGGVVGAKLSALSLNGVAPAVSFDGFVLKKNGALSAQAAHVTLPAGYESEIALGGLVPVTLQTLDIDLTSGDLNTFKLHVGAALHSTDLPLGATPAFALDGTPLHDGDLIHFDLLVDSLKDGQFRIANLGSLTIGFTGLSVGPTTSDGTISVGAFNADGQIQNIGGTNAPIAGHAHIDANSALAADATIDISGTPSFSARSATLVLNGTFNGKVSGNNGTATASAVFQMTVTATAQDPPLAGKSLTITADAQLVQATISDVVIDLGPLRVTAGQLVYTNVDANSTAPIALLKDITVTFPTFGWAPAATSDQIQVFSDHLLVTSLSIDTSGALAEAGQTIVTFAHLNVSLNNLRIDYTSTDGSLSNANFTLASGSAQISCASAALFPDDASQFTAALTPHDGDTKAFSGTLDLVTGAIAIDTDTIEVIVPKLVDVTLDGMHLSLPGPDSSTAPNPIGHLNSGNVKLLAFVDGSGDPISFTLADFSLYSDGFNIGSATLDPLNPVAANFADYLTLDGLTATLTNLHFHHGQDVGADSFQVAATDASLFDGEVTAAPGTDAQGHAVPAIQATVDFANHGFTWAAGILQATIGGTFVITATNPTLVLTDDVHQVLPILSAASIEASIPELGLSASLSNVALYRDGHFDLTGGDIVAPNGVAKTLGIADFLPFDITGAHISFLGASTNGVFNDRLNNILISVTGTFNTDLLSSLPFTPIISIGPQVSSDNNTFSFSVAIDHGQIRFQDIGPITLGFSDLTIGPVTLGGSITLGGYHNGAFSSAFAGSASISGGFDDITGQSSIALSGSLGLDSSTPLPKAVLNLHGVFSVGFSIQDIFTVEDAALTFDLSASADPNTHRISLDDLAFEGLHVGGVTLKFSDVLTMSAHDVTVNFNPAPGEPIVKFGSTPTDGGLSIKLGDGTGPFAGWGGSASNFAFGYDHNAPHVYLLNGFQVGLTFSGALGGLPDWLPLVVDGVTFQFNALTDLTSGTGTLSGARVIEDLTNFTVTISAGLQGNELFPVTARATGLTLDLEKLKHNDPVNYFPITNIDSVNFGLEDLQLGPITIGGGLGFGLLDLGNGQKALFGRVLGEFAYDDIGVGIEVWITQYGPVEARVLAGAPIPIGLLVGALAGATVAGVGAVAGAEIGDRTGLILTGFQGGLVWGAPFTNIDTPLDILRNPKLHNPLVVTQDTAVVAMKTAIQNKTYTWTHGFTLAGSAVLTDEYVFGLIGLKLTLEANVGFQLPTPAAAPSADTPTPPLSVQLIGIGDLNVINLPLMSVGIAFDFTDPLQPSLDMAFALPGSNNPLGLIIPATGTFGLKLDTKGVAYGAAGAMRLFIQQIIQSSGAQDQANAMFRAVLDQIAAKLQANHNLRLSQIVLDLNGDSVVSATEDAQVITADFLMQRFVGQNNWPALIPNSLSADNITAAANAADALLNEIMSVGYAVFSNPAEFGVTGFDLNAYANDPIFQKLQQLSTDVNAQLRSALAGDPSLARLLQSVNPNSDLGQTAMMVLVALARIMGPALLSGGQAFISQMDPSITMSGALQPAILGIPLGPPLSDATMRIDKHGIMASVNVSLASELFGFGAVLGEALGAPDFVGTESFSLPFGDDGIDLLTNLLNNQPFPTIDPFDKNWGVEIGGTLKVGAFPVGQIHGILVAPGSATDVNTFLDSHVQKLFDPNVHYDPLSSKIPIQNIQHWNSLVQYGGLLISGWVSIPHLITDPVDTRKQLVLQPPDNPLQYPSWLQSNANVLSQVDTPAQIQLYIPSLETLLITNFSATIESQRISYNTTIDNVAQFVRTNAYLEGTWGGQSGSNGKFLSVPIARGYLTLDQNGLHMSVSDSVFGFQAEYGMGYHDIQVGTDAAGQPIVQKLAYANAGAALPLPDGSSSGGTIAVEVNKLLDTLGVPQLRFSGTSNSSAAFHAYTPDFNPADADPLQRFGGFSLDAHMSIARLVNDANFNLVVPLYDPSTLLNGATPDFTASASIDHFDLPGLTPAPGFEYPLSLSGASIMVVKTGSTTVAQLGGTVSLLNSTLSASGSLTATSDGFFGQLSLSPADQSTQLMLSGVGYQFSGTASLLINSTLAPHTVAGLSLAANSARIHLVGALTVGDVTLGGTFDLTVSRDAFIVAGSGLNAIVKVGGMQLLNAAVSGAILLSRSGIATRLTVPGGSSTLHVGASPHFDGLISIVVNTTTQAIANSQLNVAAGPYVMLRVTGVTNGQLGRLHIGNFDISGNFDLTNNPDGTLNVTASNASMALVAGGTTIFTFGSFGGSLLIKPTGIVGTFFLTLTSAPPAGLGFSLTGTYSLHVDTVANPNVTVVNIANGTLPLTDPALVGLALTGVNGSLTIVGADSIDLALTSGALQMNVGSKRLLALSSATGTLAINHRGISGHLALTRTAGPDSTLGFDLGGTFGLDINTTGAVDTADVQITGATVSVPGGVSLTNATLTLTVARGSSATLAGSGMASLKLGSLVLFSGAASGTFQISTHGIAADLSVSGPTFHLPGSAPASLVGTTTVSIDTTGATDIAAVLVSNGTLVIGGVPLVGSFGVSLAANGSASIAANAAISLNAGSVTVLSGHVIGTLDVTTAGLSVSIGLTNAAVSLPGHLSARLDGTYTLGIDTTHAAPLIQVRCNNATLSVGGYQLTGTFDFVQHPGWISVTVSQGAMALETVDGRRSLQILGLSSAGSLAIRSDGIFGLLAMSENFNQLAPAALSAQFSFNLNTTSVDRSISGVIVAANTATVAFTGDLSVGGFTIHGDGTLGYQNGLLQVSLAGSLTVLGQPIGIHTSAAAPLSVNLVSVAKTIHAQIRGTLTLDSASAGVALAIGGFAFSSVGATLTLDSQGAAFAVSGTVSLPHFQTPLQFSGAISSNGSVSLTGGPQTVALGASIGHSPAAMTASFSLSKPAGNVQAVLAATGVGIHWDGLADLAVSGSVQIASDGTFDVALTAQSLHIGRFVIDVPSLHAKTTNGLLGPSFELVLNSTQVLKKVFSPTVTLPFGSQTYTLRLLSAPLTISASTNSFHVALDSTVDLTDGVFSVAGNLALDWTSGVLKVSVTHAAMGFGNGFAPINFPDFAIASDSSFSASALVPSFGPLSGTTVTLSQSGAVVNLQVSNASIPLPGNRSFTLPPLTMNSSGNISQTFAVSTSNPVKLGSIFEAIGGSFKFTLNTASGFSLSLNSTTASIITINSSNLTLRSFTLSDSGGVFTASGTLDGTLLLTGPGKTYNMGASLNLALDSTGNIRLSGGGSVNLGFKTMSFSGTVNSDGSYSFTASAGTNLSRFPNATVSVTLSNVSPYFQGHISSPILSADVDSNGDFKYAGVTFRVN